MSGRSGVPPTARTAVTPPCHHRSHGQDAAGPARQGRHGPGLGRSRARPGHRRRARRVLAVPLIRAFKEAYGETPGQYLTHRRIERAEDLLRTANLSVTEICHLVGFSSVGTFSARFKAWTGLTPSEYRSKHVGRGAALIPGCYAMLWAGGFRSAPASAEERNSGEAR